VRLTVKGEPLLPIAAVAALFAVRFHAFLSGGVLYLRDAGFFFVPWRTITARLLRAGELPVWNDWLSNGRALAADPNAAIFWPLTPLVVLVGPTGLVMANAALCLVLFFAALRWLGLRPWAAAGGTAILLFSGVFQSMPVFANTLTAFAPLPLAVVAASRLEGPSGRRNAVVAAAGLALSFLGGEPVVTASGATACAAVALLRRGPALPRLRLFAMTGALALVLASVQIVPTIPDLLGSTRFRAPDAAAGALYWSVRPARMLTLLEPRLVGDPFAEKDSGYWGAATFDAGNPYFLDLALGLVPLALAFTAFREPRGRKALALAALGALLGTGRHFPPVGLALEHLTLFRYPEKWWLLTTAALAAAAAMTIDALLAPDGRAVLGRLGKVSLGLSLPLAVLWLLPDGALRATLWGVGLGAGTTPASEVATALGPLLLLGAVSLLGIWLVSLRPLPGPLVAAVLGCLFLADAARRVAGTCPAGAPGLYETSPDPRARGRFYDEAADDPRVALRRAAAVTSGLDPMRAATGVLSGVLYAMDNDIDRMTPYEATLFSRRTAALPWGEAKLARLRVAGVGWARRDTDEIVTVEPTRAEFLFLPEAKPFTDLDLERPGHEPLTTGLFEGPAGTFGTGTVEVLERRAHRLRLRVTAGSPRGYLAIARTYDPAWRATVDGRAAPLLRAEGFLSALFVPEGTHEVELRYSLRWFALGSVLSLLGLAASIALWRRP